MLVSLLFPPKALCICNLVQQVAKKTINTHRKIIVLQENAAFVDRNKLSTCYDSVINDTKMRFQYIFAESNSKILEINDHLSNSQWISTIL